MQAALSRFITSSQRNKDTADALINACGKIADGGYDGQFIVNPLQGGGGTSFNMNANEIIANIALETLGCEKGDYDIVNPLNHANMSQSTNDVFPAAINLALILKLDSLLPVLIKAKETLLLKSSEFSSVMKMGRTHLNAASPISFGQCFDAYAHTLNRDYERIKTAADNLRDVPLGGTVVGTGLSTTQKYRERVIEHLREISGIKVQASANLADGIHNADQYTALSSVLKVCALNLSKIASDMRLLGSDGQYGFGEIILPPMQIGSSIIPDKVNPVIAELINNVSFMVCGYDLTVSMAAQSGQLELNVYKPVISTCLFKSADMMTESINLFERLYLREIKVNKNII